MLKLRELGHSVVALCPQGNLSPTFALQGIDHVPYSIERGSKGPLSSLKSIADIYRQLRVIQPDLLHTFTIKPNIFGSLAGRAAQVPVIINSITGLGSMHVLTGDNSSCKAHLASRLIDGLARLAMSRSAAVIVQNPDDYQHVLQRKVAAANKLVMIKGSGVNTETFHPPKPHQRLAARTRLGVPSTATTITMISRLIRDKGTLEYLMAAKQILAQDPRRELIFFMVGEPDEGNPSSLSSADLAPYQGIPNLRFLGHRDDIAQILHATDIYCLPSYREGLPMSVLEAMASGLPIITTDAPGCRETVRHGYNGFLIKVGDRDALAAALLEFTSTDEPRRALLGQHSRERAISEFSVEAVVTQHIELYKQTTQQAAGQRRQDTKDQDSSGMKANH